MSAFDRKQSLIAISIPQVSLSQTFDFKVGANGGDGTAGSGPAEFKSLKEMEAGVGIEPAYTALQAAA